jgi:hypothetical protein
VETFSFEPDSSKSINAHRSSGFTIAPLFRSEHLSAVCIRLELVGIIGRHEASCRRLFAVMTGSTLVSGDDGVEHGHSAREAAIWQASETHEPRSDSGLVAIAIEGDS